MVTSELQGISYAGSPYDPQAIPGKSLWLIPGAYKRGRYIGGLWTGTFLRVKCAIWNVARRGHFDRDSDLMLFGKKDAETGIVVPDYIYMPVNWGEDMTDPSKDLGRTYIYTLRFGEGNSAKSQDGLNLNGIASWELRVE